MYEISGQDADAVGGGGFVGWIGSMLGEKALDFVGEAVFGGQIDYAGVAESQGHYYIALGA